MNISGQVVIGLSTSLCDHGMNEESPDWNRKKWEMLFYLDIKMSGSIILVFIVIVCFILIDNGFLSKNLFALIHVK